MSPASTLVAMILILSSSQGQGAAPCGNPLTTIEMRECAAFKLKIAESDLEHVYSTMLSKLPEGPPRQMLLASQESWKKFRESEAEFESHFYAGGTIQLQIRLDCMTRVTQARVNELRQLLKEEFDR
jgi:uncharacterized protein YecT (DUF1311 family)